MKGVVHSITERRGLLILLNVIGVIVSTRMVAKVGFAQTMTVRLIILGIRSFTPLACLLFANNTWSFFKSSKGTLIRHLLWYAASTWSVLEVLFFVYLSKYTRYLSRQTVRRWIAIQSNSTEEKRKASMQRYLLMIAQVSRGGSDGSKDASAIVESSRRQFRNRVASHTTLAGQGGLVEESPRALEARHGSSPSLWSGSRTNVSSPTRGLGVGRIFSSTNLLESLANQSSFQKREASVDNLLENISHSSGRRDGSEALTEEQFQRLKCLEIANWFHGPDRDREAENPAAWLMRGNVEDWVAHYWFRGATPEELKSKQSGAKELSNLVDMVLEFTGLELHEGRNPNITCYLVMSDPLRVAHRPLLVYVASSVICPMATHQVMTYLGFQKERIGGLAYWYRGARKNIRSEIDLAGSQQLPMVVLHGLGVGLVPYWLFIHRLSERCSGQMLVPCLPFLAMVPWEHVPSAREMVAQLEDMLAANHCSAAHFVAHSFGCTMLGWVLKLSPQSVMCATFLEPANLVVLKSDFQTRLHWDPPVTAMDTFMRYFLFRELFAVNLFCRCSYWEQNTLWPEEICKPAVVALSSEDVVVSSLFVKRLLEHEIAARRYKKRVASMQAKLSNPFETVSRSSADAAHGMEDNSIDIQWMDGFSHGQLLFHRKQTLKAFAKMKQMVQDSYG